MAKTELRLIQTKDLKDHPQNPRVVMRDEIIASIAANMGNEYEQQYALHVRAVAGEYEIISGHHRKRAAEKAGLVEVWAWVDDLDDAAAYMALATSNNQGELSPLEIGMHALHCETLSVGGRGKKGGLTAYAERIGQKFQNVSMYRQAATVLEDVKPHVNMRVYLDKSQQLAAIHKLPGECWQAACEWLADTEPSVADVRAKVDRLTAALEAASGGEYIKEWLPPEYITQQVLTSSDFGSGTVTRLVATAEAFWAMLNDTVEQAEVKRPLCEQLWQEFIIWIGADESATRPRAVEAKVAKLRAKLDDDGQSIWANGDWREHINDIEDGSVRLLLTDPPYGQDWQSNRRKNKHKKIDSDAGEASATEELRDAVNQAYPKLKDDGHVLVFCRHDSIAAFQGVLRDVGYTVKGLVVWAKNNHGTGDICGAFLPKHELIIHAVKGKPPIVVGTPDVIEAAKAASNRHPTEKPTDLLKTLIEATTVKGELVVDLFAGVGSTCVAAGELGREWFGCEIDKEYYAVGSKRLGL